IAVALGEALKPEFKVWARQVVRNAQALGEALVEGGMIIVTGGTDNHMILAECGKGKGVFMQDALDAAGITLNKNTIPKEPESPFYPSGIRMGTPIVTIRGMKEPEMKKIGSWIARVYKAVSEYVLPEGKEERTKYLEDFRSKIKKNDGLMKIRGEVNALCREFPLYP
ncbi:hypothetical protein L0Y49_01700, partial [bacterium]|nr:hypothetical protein [bacterium]